MAESQGHFIARQQPLESELMKGFASPCAFSLLHALPGAERCTSAYGLRRPAHQHMDCGGLHISIWAVAACTSAY